MDKLKPGDIDPILGRKIKEIIFGSDTFIVYMDDNDTIQWSTKGHSVYGDKFGDIANQISFWETTCNKIFSKQDAYDYKCLLAEGYARMLDDGNQESAQRAINLTKNKINIHGKEVLRQQYLVASLCFTGIVGSIIVLLVIFRSEIIGTFNNDIYSLLISSLFGGVGAFVSTIIRARNYNAEIAISKCFHQADGILRIIYGLVAGGLIGLGIKSNLVFGFINELQRNNIYAMAFLGAIGGASEMLVPSIIKQIENHSSS